MVVCGKRGRRRVKFGLEAVPGGRRPPYRTREELAWDGIMPDWLNSGSVELCCVMRQRVVKAAIKWKMLEESLPSQIFESDEEDPIDDFEEDDHSDDGDEEWDSDGQGPEEVVFTAGSTLDGGGDSDAESSDDDTGTVDYSDAEYSDESEPLVTFEEEEPSAGYEENDSDEGQREDQAAEDTQLQIVQAPLASRPAKKRKTEPRPLAPSLPPVELTKRQKTKVNKLLSAMASKPSGLQQVELVVGTGPIPRPGRKLLCRYVLRLENQFGPVLDQSGLKPFEFRPGLGEVIEGWEEGVKTMRAGGKRAMMIPPNLGYGSRGRGGVPPKATLYCELELL